MTAKKPSKKLSSRNDDVLKRHIVELEASHKRLAAEYANFQRRSEEEKDKLTNKIKINLLEELFPVMDNLERSSTHAPTINLSEVSRLGEEDFKKIANYFVGLRLIEKQLQTVLTQAGLTRIATKGQPFDHNLHEAVSHEPNAGVPADHIIEEVQPGYQIGERIVRPAKVRVSQG